jgi:hypothetical protein
MMVAGGNEYHQRIAPDLDVHIIRLVITVEERIEGETTRTDSQVLNTGHSEDKINALGTMLIRCWKGPSGVMLVGMLLKGSTGLMGLSPADHFLPHWNIQADTWSSPYQSSQQPLLWSC